MFEDANSRLDAKQKSRVIGFLAFFSILAFAVILYAYINDKVKAYGYQGLFLIAVSFSIVNIVNLAATLGKGHSKRVWKLVAIQNFLSSVFIIAIFVISIFVVLINGIPGVTAAFIIFFGIQIFLQLVFLVSTKNELREPYENNPSRSTPQGWSRFKTIKITLLIALITDWVSIADLIYGFIDLFGSHYVTGLKLSSYMAVILLLLFYFFRVFHESALFKAGFSPNHLQKVCHIRLYTFIVGSFCMSSTVAFTGVVYIVDVILSVLLFVLQYKKLSGDGSSFASPLSVQDSDNQQQ